MKLENTNNNPNHKKETKDKKELEAEHSLAYSKKLNEQDSNENFLNLKKDLIFFQDKEKIDEIRANLSEVTRFLKISDELQPEDVKSNGLDFVILADVSESMYPFRIYLKKSMYYAIKDIESFAYRGLESSDDEFPKVRFAIIKYTDRENDSEPGKIDVLDFVEYSSLDKIIEKIDEIEIKQSSEKKRAVFDGMKALHDLKWEESSIKMVLHYAADPEYGVQFTTNPKKMGDNYDPFPNGITDLSHEDVLEPIVLLGPTYNFISLTDRLTKFTKEIQEKLALDLNSPVVTPLN